MTGMACMLFLSTTVYYRSSNCLAPLPSDAQKVAGGSGRGAGSCWSPGPYFPGSLQCMGEYPGELYIDPQLTIGSFIDIVCACLCVYEGNPSSDYLTNPKNNYSA